MRDFVVVDYDGDLYPGEVLALHNGDYWVNTMHPIEEIPGMYKWPNPVDQLLYKSNKVIKKIREPLPVGTGSRIQWRFADAISRD